MLQKALPLLLSLTLSNTGAMDNNDALKHHDKTEPRIQYEDSEHLIETLYSKNKEQQEILKASKSLQVLLINECKELNEKLASSQRKSKQLQAEVEKLKKEAVGLKASPEMVPIDLN
jgi:hypothetical protein